jgi:hypothetical protein
LQPAAPEDTQPEKNKTPKALSKATTFFRDNRPPLLAADYYYSTFRRAFIGSAHFLLHCSGQSDHPATYQLPINGRT